MNNVDSASCKSDFGPAVATATNNSLASQIGTGRNDSALAVAQTVPAPLDVMVFIDEFQEEHEKLTMTGTSVYVTTTNCSIAQQQPQSTANDDQHQQQEQRLRYNDAVNDHFHTTNGVASIGAVPPRPITGNNQAQQVNNTDAYVVTYKDQVNECPASRITPSNNHDVASDINDVDENENDTLFSTITMSNYDQQQFSSIRNDNVDASSSPSIPLIEAELCGAAVVVGATSATTNDNTNTNNNDTLLVHASVIDTKSNKPGRNRILFAAIVILLAVVIILIVVIVKIVIQGKDYNTSSDKYKPTTFSPSPVHYAAQTVVPTTGAPIIGTSMKPEPSYKPTTFPFGQERLWFVLDDETIEESTYNRSQIFDNGVSTDMSKDGFTVIVGNTIIGERNGSRSFYPPVSVYTYAKRNWYLVANVWETFKYDSTGQSVSVNGNGSIFAVGSPSVGSSLVSDSNNDYNNSNETVTLGNAGTVRIYLLNTTSDTYQSIYTESSNVNANPLHNQIGNDIRGLSNGDEFGYSIDLSDDGRTIAIAARKGCYVQVYVYNEPNLVWDQIGQTLYCSWADNITNSSSENDAAIPTTLFDNNATINNTNDESFTFDVQLSSSASVLAITGPFGIESDTILTEKGALDGLHVFQLNYDTTAKTTTSSSSRSDTPFWIRTGQPNDFRSVPLRVGSKSAVSNDGTVVLTCGVLLNSVVQSCRVFQYTTTTNRTDNNNSTDSNTNSTSNNNSNNNNSSEVLMVGKNNWDQIGQDIVDYDETWLSTKSIASVSMDSTGMIVAIGIMGNYKYPDYGANYWKVMKYNTTQGIWEQIGNIPVDVSTLVYDNVTDMSSVLSSDGTLLVVGATSAAGQAVAVYELGIDVWGGSVPIEISIETVDDTDVTTAYFWRLQRYDVSVEEQQGPVYISKQYNMYIDGFGIATSAPNEYTDDVSGTRNTSTTIRQGVYVQSEGVYRFSMATNDYVSYKIIVNGTTVAVFENSFNSSSLKVDDDSDQVTFAITKNHELRSSSTVYINDNHSDQDEQPETTSPTATITLVINFDERPYDIHWVLFAAKAYKSLNDTNDTVYKTTYDEEIDDDGGNNRTIIAFGPERVYSTELAMEQYIEIITIPSSLLLYDNDDDGTEVVYTFVLTDDGRDGLCCRHGMGNVQMYFGTDFASSFVDDNVTTNPIPLFSNSTENMKRFVHSFTL